MRIATWNVNSIRQRLEPLLAWLKDCSPDIVCLQEIKCVDEAFPRLEIEELGYNVVTHGQKTFNGVALLSKLPFDETKSGLAGDDEDAHARFLEGVVTLKKRRAADRLPLSAQWQPGRIGKYPYKLNWMSRLLEYSKERLKAEEPLVLAGDFNVIPEPEDVHNPAAWVEDALFRSTTRESFQSLLGLGLTDALRAVNDAPGQYTFWDYQAGAWQKNWGLRIDHLLLSPQAERPADRCRDRQLRARLGKAVGPCAGLGRSRSGGGVAPPPQRLRVISPAGPAPSARASAAPWRGHRRTLWQTPGCSFP